MFADMFSVVERIRLELHLCMNVIAFMCVRARSFPCERCSFSLAPGAQQSVHERMTSGVGVELLGALRAVAFHVHMHDVRLTRSKSLVGV